MKTITTVWIVTLLLLKSGPPTFQRDCTTRGRNASTNGLMTHQKPITESDFGKTESKWIRSRVVRIDDRDNWGQANQNTA